MEKKAESLNISWQTLYRRLEELGIHCTDYTEMSGSDIDEVLLEIKQDFPNDGEVMLQGHLRRRGMKVRRNDLRSAIHRVDHDNTIARMSHVVNRRVYTTPHPNYVWHIDGNHKLIRWRFVIHAGVDGFSRMIVFARCSNNNRAGTVLEVFLSAVSAYGLPCSVRTDHGGENVDICQGALAHSSLYFIVLTFHY